MKKLCIGINGILPQPYGGVATTCYHLSSQFLSKGHRVYFYDRTSHVEKHCQEGLVNYTQTAIKKNIAILIFGMLWRSLSDRKHRSLLSHFIQDAFDLKLFRANLKIIFRTLLILLEINGSGLMPVVLQNLTVQTG